MDSILGMCQFRHLQDLRLQDAIYFHSNSKHGKGNNSTFDPERKDLTCKSKCKSMFPSLIIISQMQYRYREMSFFVLVPFIYTYLKINNVLKHQR